MLEDHGDAVWLAIIDANLAGPRRELARRERRRAAGAGPGPEPGWVRAQRETMARLRREADIRYPLDLRGWTPTRRSAAGEVAGPCPLCAKGHDRFVVWPATATRDGRVWCRRCGYANDVIGLYRDLLGVPFATAVRELARVTGIPVPEPDAAAIRLVGHQADRSGRGGAPGEGGTTADDGRTG